MAEDETTAIPALMTRNLLEVFGERDRDARRAAIAELYAPDARLVDPEGSGSGRDAIDAAAEAVLARFPELHFAPTAPPSGVGDLGRAAWELRDADETAVVRGMDVVTVAEGRITRIWIFVD
jgi:SnoaL-like domain